MDFLQQQDAQSTTIKNAAELDPRGVEASEGGCVCVVVLCWGVGGCRFWMWFLSTRLHSRSAQESWDSRSGQDQGSRSEV